MLSEAVAVGEGKRRNKAEIRISGGTRTEVGAAMNGDNMATEIVEGERTNGVGNDNEVSENTAGSKDVMTGAVELNDAEVDAESAEPNSVEEDAGVEELKNVELVASEEPPVPKIESNNVEPKKVTSDRETCLTRFIFF